MDNQEILNRFDVLYNNIMSNQAPGLDGYEKSVFWNKALLEVLKNHLNPKGNKYGEGFDGSAKRQVDFSSLTCTANFVFGNNDKLGAFNAKAFCYQGREVEEYNDVERYYVTVETVVDEDGNTSEVYVTRKHTVTEASIKIVDTNWPDDVLSIVNETLDVLNTDDWTMFILYLSKFITYEFTTDTGQMVKVCSEYIDWALDIANELGFDANHPVFVYLDNKLTEAKQVYFGLSNDDQNTVPASEIFNGIGFSTVKTYRDTLLDLGLPFSQLTIVPLNNVEYDTLMSRPYKYPPRSQAWRIVTNGEPEFIIPPGFHPVQYCMRYVKKPKDVDLTDNNDIPEVPEVLYDEILQRAVELAKNSWEGNIETTKAFGERSE